MAIALVRGIKWNTSTHPVILLEKKRRRTLETPSKSHNQREFGNDCEKSEPDIVLEKDDLDYDIMIINDMTKMNMKSNYACKYFNEPDSRSARNMDLFIYRFQESSNRHIY